MQMTSKSKRIMSNSILEFFRGFPIRIARQVTDLTFAAEATASTKAPSLLDGQRDNEFSPKRRIMYRKTPQYLLASPQGSHEPRRHSHLIQVRRRY
jgi:hypothetical protein